MRKPLPQGLTGRQIIESVGKPDYKFWYDKTQDCAVKYLRFKHFMRGHEAVLIPN